MARAFDVALGRPGYRTPIGTFHIYYKRKPAGGALGACAMRCSVLVGASRKIRSSPAAARSAENCSHSSGG